MKHESERWTKEKLIEGIRQTHPNWPVADLDGRNDQDLREILRIVKEYYGPNFYGPISLDKPTSKDKDAPLLHSKIEDKNARDPSERPRHRIDLSDRIEAAKHLIKAKVAFYASKKKLVLNGYIQNKQDLPDIFPAHLKKRHLRLYRQVFVDKEDGETFEEFVSPKEEKELYKKARVLLTPNRRRPKSKPPINVPTHRFYRKKWKGELLHRAAKMLSEKAKIELLRRAASDPDFEKIEGEQAQAYGQALIELTKTKKKCLNCSDPLPYLRKLDPLRKFLPQEFYRKRVFCSDSCRASSRA